MHRLVDQHWDRVAPRVGATSRSDLDHRMWVFQALAREQSEEEFGRRAAEES